MILLAHYTFIVVVQSRAFDNRSSYFASVPQSEIDHPSLEKLMFGFHQGIDDNHNRKMPSYINTVLPTNIFLGNGQMTLREDYYAVPDEALENFTRAIVAYSGSESRDSFFFWYEWEKENFMTMDTDKHELLTDEFYNSLNGNGGL